MKKSICILCISSLLCSPFTAFAGPSGNTQASASEPEYQPPSLRREIRALQKGDWIHLTTEQKLEDLDLPITIAVMGCAVNGPGEARGADLGIACGKGEGLIFKKGTILYKVPEQQLVQALVREVEELKKEISREALLNKG